MQQELSFKRCKSKLQVGMSRLDIGGKNFFRRVLKHWDRFLREVIESPLLKVLKSQVDKALAGMI